MTPPAHAMTVIDFPTPPDRDLLQLARQLRLARRGTDAGAAKILR